MSMHSDGRTWTGRFSDGTSATSAPATVRLNDRGIVILRHGPSGEAGGPGDLVWPYGALATGTPLSKGTGDVVVSYSYQPGATLFVADAGFAATLASVAPHLSTRAVRWQQATPWLWAAAAVAVLGLGVWLSGLSPARTVAGLLPDGVRERLGAQVIASMTADKPICAAPAGKAALDALTHRLSTAAGGARFKVVVADWGLVNAFAAPGEQIVLTRGLLLSAESADEVAGVLAHEMGHGLARHPEAGVVRVIGLTAAAELLLGGSAGTLTSAGILLAQLSYTRDAEREADATALALLRGSAVSAKGLAAFFRRMEARGPSGSRGTKSDAGTVDPQSRDPKSGGPAGTSETSFLSTHPAVAERVRVVEAVAPYPATPALSAEQWAALRDICRR